MHRQNNFGLASYFFFNAPDIRTAEAAKVIENIQRDLNIALVNELAIIFNRCRHIKAGKT